MPIMSRLAHGRVHYGWVVAATTFFVLLAAAGIRATPSVLLAPLEREFGWTRSTTSAAVAVNILLYGMIGPFSAAFIERLGAKRVVMGALALLVLGAGLTTFMTASWQLILLWGVVVGVGSGSTALVLGAVIVNRWFSQRRGLVMGILTASTATGQLVFLPLLASTVESQGWRGAVYIVAGVALALIPIVFLFMRERPRDLGLAPFGATEMDAATPPPSSVNPFVAPLVTLAAAAKTRDFWLLAGGFFVCGASTNGLIGTHLISACLDHGLDAVTGASLLATMGVLDFFGTTLSGWLSDRWDNRVLLGWYYGLRGLSLLFLPLAFDVTFYGLPIFAVFYGLDWIATVPPTVRLISNRFGKDKAGMIFGWVAASHQVGASFAAIGAGVIRQDFASYDPAFVIAGILCGGAAMASLMVGRGGAAPVRPVAAAA